MSEKAASEYIATSFSIVKYLVFTAAERLFGHECQHQKTKRRLAQAESGVARCKQVGNLLIARSPNWVRKSGPPYVASFAGLQQ